MKVTKFERDEKTDCITISIHMDDETVDHRTFEGMGEVKEFAFTPVPVSRDDAFRLACQLVCEGIEDFETLVQKQGVEIDVKSAEATERRK